MARRADADDAQRVVRIGIGVIEGEAAGPDAWKVWLPFFATAEKSGTAIGALPVLMMMSSSTGVAAGSDRAQVGAILDVARAQR